MISSKRKFLNNTGGISDLAEYIISSLGETEKYKIRNPKNISSIFLAGAPGAGKSEFLERIFTELRENFVVIDIDSYRCMFEGYTGENSSEYQQASVKVADKILKFCFQNELNFIFDGTFRNYNKVEQNLRQCEERKRKVMITLIFQDPRISFYYTFLRKLEKKRNVPIDIFIDGFYSSVANTFRAHRDFSNTHILIASKTYNDIDSHDFDYRIHEDIKDIEVFCKKFKMGYNRGVFTNRENLKIDIEHFHNILVANFCKRGNMLARLKIWFFKKLYNN